MWEIGNENERNHGEDLCIGVEMKIKSVEKDKNKRKCVQL